ncbi:hypothetical protein BCR39DRAFT_513085 [Naematelia encephala]|uniref:Uncharacterized protein n=1 Tax=Naematelia encephala TaxID=71784 RepID=A0A1Y2BME0_9TREE|nr:hypothetical protein BCR39DRAFT_513085 [Naematelia encephala]
MPVDQRSSNPLAFVTQPTRRTLRVYALLALGFITLLVLSNSSSLSESALDYSQTIRALSSFDGSQSSVAKFRQRFPSLRNVDQRGVPDESDHLLKREDNLWSGSGVFDWPRTTKMFVFGDSYSTIDSDYRKNGVDGGHHERFHHKATDMKWSDYLYAVFHDFHVLQYYNFARPGATVAQDIIPPGLEKYGTYTTQLQEFEDLFTPLPGPPRVNWHDNDTLFVVFFGINDMGRMNREDIGRMDIPETSTRLARSVVEQTKRLYTLGARSFLFLNLPPLDRSPKYNLPSEVGIRSHDLIKQSTDVFNEQLETAVDEWKLELSAKDDSSEIMFFDLHSFYSTVLEYPELFGMTDCGRYQMTVDGKRPNLGRMGYW